MTFLRKHPVEVAVLLLVVTCLGLYLFLVRPVMVRRQGIIKTTEEKLAQLQKYRNNPPSPEMRVRLTREKEMLENQYEGVRKTLNFTQRVPVPEETGQLALYFEEQLEKTGNELRPLEGTSGIKIPDRLGFKQEKPQNREELSTLLSQLALARKLVSLVAEAGVSNLSIFNPLPFSRKEVATIRREGIEPGGGGYPEGGVPTVSGDRLPRGGANKSLPEELKFELGVRAKISALTNLLYHLANNNSYFFTVRDLEIKSVTDKGRGASFVEEEQFRRGRRRRVLPGNLLRKKLKEKGKTSGKVELEAKLLVSTRLFPSNEEGKKGKK